MAIQLTGKNPARSDLDIKVRPCWALVFLLFFLIPCTSQAAIIKPSNNLGLMGYWSFDEGSGTAAGDHSGRGNKGTLVSGTGLPAWVAGKIGTSLSFDGGGGYVSTPSSSALNLTSSLTIAAWVKVGTDVSNYRMIISKESTAGQPWPFRLYLEQSTGKLIFDFTVSSVGKAFTTSTAINDNQWHYVVAVRDDTGKTAAVYIDGVSRASGSYTGTPDTGATAARIGISPYTGGGAGGSYPYVGTIDELRLYNRAFSQADVTALYNTTKSTKANASAQTLGNGSTLKNGLMGWWTFDGADISGTTATDRGSGAHNGTLTGSPKKVQGEFGQALQFNGSSNYASLGHVQDGATAFTWSAWIQTTQSVVPINFYNKPNIVGTLQGAGFGNDAQLGLWAGQLAFYDEFSGGANNVITNTLVNDGKWHQVAVTRSGTSLIFYVDGTNIYTDSTGSNALNSLGFEVARATYDATTFFSGSVDDVRIYNRALSAAEMRQLYQQGGDKLNASGATLQNGTTLASGLVGYWSFNGADTTDKIYDRSGNGNNGYLNPGVSTSSMKVAGRLGQALAWDGASKYIVVPDNATLDGSDITLAGWFKFGAVNGTYQTMFGKWYVSAKQQFLVQLNTDNKIGWWTGDGGGGGGVLESVTTPVAGKWYFVVATISGTSQKLYINGTLDASGTGAAIGASNVELTIGGKKNSGGSYFEPFTGSMDELRVYNRALSAAEVTQLYQLGK